MFTSPFVHGPGRRRKRGSPIEVEEGVRKRKKRDEILQFVLWDPRHRLVCSA